MESARGTFNSDYDSTADSVCESESDFDECHSSGTGRNWLLISAASLNARPNQRNCCSDAGSGPRDRGSSKSWNKNRCKKSEKQISEGELELELVAGSHAFCHVITKQKHHLSQPKSKFRGPDLIPVPVCRKISKLIINENN